jgi:hypothetical protein
MIASPESDMAVFLNMSFKPARARTMEGRKGSLGETFGSSLSCNLPGGGCLG